MPGEPDIVLYAAHAPTVHGSWRVESDDAAAGGARLMDPDAGRAKVTQPLAAPTDYFELTFQAAAEAPTAQHDGLLVQQAGLGAVAALCAGRVEAIDVP